MAKENKNNSFTNAYKKNKTIEEEKNVDNEFANINDDFAKEDDQEEIFSDNESKKNKKIKEYNKELEKRIEELNLMLVESNEKIKELEMKVKDYENNFTLVIKSKEEQAQKIVNQKIEEYRQKFENELKNAKKFALKDKALDLIEIINQFDSVVSIPNKNPEVQNYIIGFTMFSNKFKNYLEDNNIFEIKIQENDDFNPEFMEAIDIQEKSNVGSQKVIRVITKGYKIHDQLLVPAKVIISK